MSKIRNRKSKNPGCFGLKGLRKLSRPPTEKRSPRLTKAFEVETSRVFTLPVAYFAHNIIDFRSSLTMSRNTSLPISIKGKASHLLCCCMTCIPE